jgi:adenosylcobinamide-GDP ribazoletransferase
MNDTPLAEGAPSWAERLVLALGFLSRIPMPGGPFARHPGFPLAATADMFGLAGLVISLPAAITLALASALWPPAIACALALAVLVAITGALHEDGLADCADAFFGARDVPRRLDIMKDSRIGAYGATALIVVLLAEWAALTAIMQAHGGLAAAIALMVATSASRAGLVWHWQVLPEARPEGLAASQGKPQWRAVQASAAMAGAAALLTVPMLLSAVHFIAFIFAGSASALAAMIVARAKIGGMTGDTLGMSAKITMLGGLLALAIG